MDEEKNSKEPQNSALNIADVSGSAFGGVFWTGHDCLYYGKKYHVQDVNRLSQTLKIGIPDKYNLVWDSFWVDSYTKDGDCIKFFTNENETSKSIVLCGEYTIIEN